MPGNALRIVGLVTRRASVLHCGGCCDRQEPGDPVRRIRSPCDQNEVTLWEESVHPVRRMWSP